jgi:tetratricopeptide (TPR) repeat protein
MATLFDVMEKASGLFVQEEYARAIPLFERILAADGHNLDAVLRLATAHSVLGHERQALALFERAKAVAPLSEDVKTYLALHLARGPRWEEAIPMLEKAVAETPDRLPALEALARIRERQGRVRDALDTRRKIYDLRRPTTTELLRLGQQAMEVEDTALAIRSFESARVSFGGSFTFNLELGVLYLASRRFEEAKTALDRVSPQHPAYAMALFKRAQVSVLLHEPDSAARIEAARRQADATTRELIARERLFQSSPR